jgi:predicted metal-dependent phosphoesterase TrpH
VSDVVADLHVHTTASDGELALGDVADAARAAGLDAVALTDHDRYHPGLDAPVSDLGGVTAVRGVELRVETDRQRLDLLGYGLRETDALAAEIDRLQRDRIERAREMAALVETRLGVGLDLEFGPGVGRPHVARAVDASDAPLDYQGAFDDLVGDGGPCYVPRDVTGFDRGVDLLGEACAVVSLAHPFRSDDPRAALRRAADLDAVERYYPYGDGVDADDALVEGVAADHDLLLTGGSDAHDRTLGVAGLDGEAWATLRERLR